MSAKGQQTSYQPKEEAGSIDDLIARLTRVVRAVETDTHQKWELK
jgi:hypothetical protein